MINEERLVRLFLDLCRINAPALLERDSVAFTRKYLADTVGLEVWEDDAACRIGGNANNLIARLPGIKPGAPSIFFSAHFDTVEPTAGLKIEERDGVFYSASDTILGADDKAGMAPAIEAVHAIKESGEPHGDVYLLLTCAEEIGLLGAAAMEVETLGLDFGYVLDTGPPVGTYVTRTATHDKLDFKVIGRPAHAGKEPENGVNAIEVAAAAIAQMKIGRIGPETVANVGTIQGGTATNVVPAECVVHCEARSTNVDELDAQVDHMIKCFEAAAAQFGATVEVHHDRHYRNYDISPDQRVVQVGVEASRRLGMKPDLRTTLGGSDANVFNARGIPSIVLATGMKEIHTHNEHVSRKDLVDTARLALEIIRVASG